MLRFRRILRVRARICKAQCSKMFPLLSLIYLYVYGLLGGNCVMPEIPGQPPPPPPHHQNSVGTCRVQRVAQ